jgi:hypothetical protein
LLPRERKTANCFEALEAIHNRSQPDRRPMADEGRLRPQRTALSCQTTAGQQHGCHRACTQPKPPHSKATPVTKDSHHSDRYPRRVRHSQLNTTTSPVSKAPAAPLLRLFSADAWNAKIHCSSRNLQAIPQGNPMNRIISRMPTMSQIQIVDIGHIVMTRVRMVLTARGPCDTP